jgi:alpha-L-fucosidase
VNREAIYDTRPRVGDLWKEGADVSFADPNTASGRQTATGENSPIRFTRTKDGREVYAICMQWPGSQLRLKTVRAKTGSKVTLLGENRPLKWRNEADALAIRIPDALQDEAQRPCKVAWCFRIESVQA